MIIMQRGLQGGATCRWVVIGQGLEFIWVVLRILGPFNFSYGVYFGA